MTVDHNLLCFFFPLERPIPVYNILNVLPLSTLSGLREEGGTRTAASTRTDNNKVNKVASYKRAETKLFC